MSERLYIYVKDWERFQPRSDRPGLPWLRLHTDLLSNDDWIELAAAEKVLLTVIWMVTQRHGNGRTVASERWLRGQAGLRHGHLEPLVQAGFITLSTTKAAPTGHQTGALEENRIEKEKEKSPTTAPNGRPPALEEEEESDSYEPMTKTEMQEALAHIRPQLDAPP